jgi:hypothetical protein
LRLRSPETLGTRQWRLNQQRDAYVALVSALNVYGTALDDLINTALYKDRSTVESVKSKLATATVEFLRAEIVSELFCGEHVQTAMLEIPWEIAKASSRYNWALADRL